MFRSLKNSGYPVEGYLYEYISYPELPRDFDVYEELQVRTSSTIFTPTLVERFRESCERTVPTLPSKEARIEFRLRSLQIQAKLFTDPIASFQLLELIIELYRDEKYKTLLVSFLEQHPSQVFLLDCKSSGVMPPEDLDILEDRDSYVTMYGTSLLSAFVLPGFSQDFEKIRNVLKDTLPFLGEYVDAQIQNIEKMDNKIISLGS